MLTLNSIKEKSRESFNMTHDLVLNTIYVTTDHAKKSDRSFLKHDYHILKNAHFVLTIHKWLVVITDKARTWS